MANIYSLAPELIGHIIAIAYPVDSLDMDEQRARRRFLCATSLVGREWTPFAQEALWMYMRVDGSRIVDGLVDGGAGRFPIERLSLCLYKDIVKRPQFEALLAAVRGVRRLELDSGVLDFKALCSDNLRDLTSLRLVDATELQMTKYTSTPFPFHLTSLAIDYTGSIPTATLDALSHQTSITSLDLSVSYDPLAWLSGLSRMAPQLDTLGLAFASLFGRSTHGFLAQCTQLKHLTTDAHSSSCINHLINSLESCTFAYCKARHLASLLDVLNSNPAAFKKVQRLRIRTYAWYETNEDAVTEVRSWDGWEQVEAACGVREIELVVEGN